ncbi:cache domain-containing protein, partial [Treponema pedis]|uniref:cache domain-containing protein n=1 Tax=Treponema pedis TaxID=409322 RepID=UPI00056F0DAA
IARKAVTEKVETHLVDKATDIAEVVDGKITALFQFFEGVARAPIIRNPEISYQEKTAYLKKEAAFNDKIHRMDLCTIKGIRYTGDGQMIDVSEKDFYQEAAKGNKFVAEPYDSPLDNAFILMFTVPIYDDNRNIIGVLTASVRAENLSHEVKDIVVGETGYCYI